MPGMEIAAPLERATPARAARRSAATSTTLLMLLSADALFLALHLAHLSTPFLQDPRFSIEMDRGFAETYQYVKECAVLGGHLPVPPGFPLRAEHAGEAGMLAALSALSLALLALTWPADAGARRACARLLRLVALLALFGMGADAVHAMASPGTRQQGALGVVEDGGEMVVLSAIVALAVRLRRGPPEGAGGP